MIQSVIRWWLFFDVFLPGVFFFHYHPSIARNRLLISVTDFLSPRFLFLSLFFFGFSIVTEYLPSFGHGFQRPLAARKVQRRRPDFGHTHTHTDTKKN